jgi:hypothetical protein
MKDIKVGHHTGEHSSGIRKYKPLAISVDDPNAHHGHNRGNGQYGKNSLDMIAEKEERYRKANGSTPSTRD